MKFLRQWKAMTVAVQASLLTTGVLMAGGCVMSEKYEAEKARSLNFQRLLAQEEKRTSELDSEVKRTKRELAELEARNRELTAQVDAVRQQAMQIQEEAEAMKEAAMLERKAREDMKRLTTPAKPKKAERPPQPPQSLDMTPPAARDFGDEFGGRGRTQSPGSSAAMAPDTERAMPSDQSADMSADMSLDGLHTVQPGETLFRISRKYHVSVDKLRKWNNLSGDTIEVGQKLIVTQP